MLLQFPTVPGLLHLDAAKAKGQKDAGEETVVVPAPLQTSIRVTPYNVAVKSESAVRVSAGAPDI